VYEAQKAKREQGSKADPLIVRLKESSGWHIPFRWNSNFSGTHSMVSGLTAFV
jgi:hypothetical protein